MKKWMRKHQHGFTLIELMVVIAILGVLAAVTVPMVTGYLSSAKERAYDNDVKQVQAALDAHYSAPNNARFIGQRQYAILGADNSSSTLSDLLDDATNASVDLHGDAVKHKNPQGGTAGGNPVWNDDGDGIRSGVDGTDEENHNGPASAGEKGWDVVAVVRQGKTYYVDTRDYIIDLDALVAEGTLDGVPASAADDNCPTSVCTGSYIFYVDADGNVQTLLASFPESDKTGFQGVHP